MEVVLDVSSMLDIGDMVKVIVALLVLLTGLAGLGLVVLYRIDKSLRSPSAKA